MNIENQNLGMIKIILIFLGIIVFLGLFFFLTNLDKIS